jgi:hypothetical protein
MDRLCGECTTLVENHDKIRALSHAHRNVSQVSFESGLGPGEVVCSTDVVTPAEGAR